MQFSIGDIGLFLILLAFALYSIKQYHKLKYKKYLLYLLACIYGMLNRKYMISINGIEINNTIYIEILRYVMLVPMTILLYKLYKEKELY